MADKNRLIELSMVPALAAELAAQIDGPVRNVDRLTALSMIPDVAREIVGQINRDLPNKSALVELGVVPKLAEEIAAQIGSALRARNVRIVVGPGDSRAFTAFPDGALKRQKGGTDPVNIACALSMQRYRLDNAFAVSGQRVDQYMSLLPDALATGAGIMWLPSVLNTIGQDYPTASTSGQDALTRILAAADQAIAQGFIVVVMSEVGQVGMIQAKRDQINFYNNGIATAARNKRGLVFLDVRSAVCGTDNMLLPLYTYDGTHFNELGGFVVGRIVKVLFDQLMPVGASFLLGANGLPEIGGYTNRMPNPLFNVATGGTTTSGATGTFSGSSRFNKTGTATLNVTSTVGKTNLVGTFAAQNDRVYVEQEADMTGLTTGPFVRGMALAKINSSSGLAGVQMTSIFYSSAATEIYADLSATATWAGPNDSYTLLLLTQEYKLPVVANAYALVNQVAAVAFGAGGIDMDVTQVGGLIKT